MSGLKKTAFGPIANITNFRLAWLSVMSFSLPIMKQLALDSFANDLSCTLQEVYFIFFRSLMFEFNSCYHQGMSSFSLLQVKLWRIWL